MIKPILFNTKMAQAVKDNRKTATRRLVKPQPDAMFPYCHEEDSGWHWTTSDGDDDMMGWWPSFEKGVKPPYQPGDILYVRETWSRLPLSCDKYIHVYRADYAPSFKSSMFKWHPSIHMPKEAARLFLRVTSVRAERLQDMTLDDFCSEGVGIRPEAFNDPENAYWQGREVYIDIWNSTINPKDLNRYDWNANPWVWVYEFKRISKEEALKNE